VPKGLPVSSIQFLDASEGYALFQRCPAPCEVALAVTFDGGNSWLARTLPFAASGKITMFVGRGKMLALNDDGRGWFISRDSGRTFEQRPLQPPAKERNLAGPQYVVRCPGDAAGCGPKPIMEIAADGTEKPLPSQPPFGDVSDVQVGGDGRLWALHQGTDSASPSPAYVLSVAVSTNKGQSWTVDGTIRVALPVGDEAKLAVSADGADVWLVGPLYRVKRAADGHWPEPTLQSEVGAVIAAVALGGGVLLMASNRGVSTITGERWVPDGPPEVNSVRDLGGGLIQGYTNQAGVVWLCRCKGANREWIRVAVTAP
jgi:hypothetical protein